MHETPKELLELRLKEYEKALEKSNSLFDRGILPPSVHDTHVENLTPKIEDFRYAIKILTKYT
jgi:hypothetical protein